MRNAIDIVVGADIEGLPVTLASIRVTPEIYNDVPEAITNWIMSRATKELRRALDATIGKKPLREWAEEYAQEKDITLYDPDGFDRTDPDIWDREYTRAEFERGLFASTVLMGPKFLNRWGDDDDEPA